MKTIIHSLLVLGLLTVSSCSVEKRLYNKGYSVSWNKRLRQEPKENERLSYENNTSEDRDIQDVIPGINTESTTVTTSSDKAVTLPKNEPIREESATNSSSQASSSVRNFHPEKPIVHVQKLNKQKEIKVMKREGGGGGKALTLLIFAIVFALLGLVFVANFGAIGLIFGIIFYIGAALMLIASIIYFIL